MKPGGALRPAFLSPCFLGQDHRICRMNRIGFWLPCSVRRGSVLVTGSVGNGVCPRVGNGVCPRILPVNPANPAILSKRKEGPGRSGGFSTARATALPRFTHFSHTFPPEPVVDSPLERPLLSIPTVRPAFFPIYRFNRFNPFNPFNRFTLHS